MNRKIIAVNSLSEITHGAGSFSLAHKGIRMAGELPGGVVRSLFAIALTAEGCGRVSHGPCLWATGGKDG